MDRPDALSAAFRMLNLGRAAMDQQSSEKGRATLLVAGTVAAVLVWGFGVEYVLHNYVFMSPPEIAIQKVK